jgi:serine/threonine protein kinase
LEQRETNNAEMTQQQLNRLFDLFLACREMEPESRSAWLREVCKGDLSLERAVERLIREDLSAEGFLSRPTGLLTRAFAFTISAGQRFGRYTVTGFVGRGGMGEVWKAHDEELDRAVALKFLHSGFPVDQLTREARIASALNHPGILTIYDVTVWEGTPILVMELVSGPPLSRLCDGHMPLDQLISLAAQVSGALAAAHAAGIVHGDLKPDNIIWRADGIAKILDFGLARKIVTTTDATAAPLAGTPLYMSPEQARGEALTPASDIFSFGLVVYKIAVGKHAFADESPLQIVQRILTLEPTAPSLINPRVPPDLNSLIVSMLAKDAAARPSAEQVVRQFHASLETFEGKSSAVQAPHRPSLTERRDVWWLTLSGAVLAAALLAWFLFRKNSSPDQADLKIQPLTSQWGWEASPALSPDGKTVAFTRSDTFDHPGQIYLKLRDSEHLMQLTTSERQERIGPLVWSPDGKRIAFKRSAELYMHPGAIFSVSRDGGAEQEILRLKNANLSSSIDWSPDGTQLAYSDAAPNPDQLAIYLFNLQTGKKRRLTSPPKSLWGDWDPKFSSDGTEIAFKRVTGYAADDIYVTKVSGGPIRPVTAGVASIWGHAWTADRRSLIVSCQRGSTIFGLWRFPLTGRDRKPQRLLQGAADAITPATSRKTNLAVWVNQFKDLNIYRVSAKGSSTPEKFIASPLSETQAVYSPNSRIAFLSDRSGSREIWISNPDRSVQTRVTNFNDSLVDDLQWSHDGHRLACEVRTHWRPSVFTLNCSPHDIHCDPPSRFPSSGSAELPSWSADDRFLYFASDRSGRSEIYKQSIEGGPITEVTHNGGSASRESTDGRWLYFSKDQLAGVWRMALATSPGKSASAEELIIGAPYHPQCWTLAGDEIVFIDGSLNTQPAAIRAYNIVKRRMRVILSLRPLFFEKNDTRVSVSPDLQWVLYSQVDELGSNIMLAENMK